MNRVEVVRYNVIVIKTEDFPPNGRLAAAAHKTSAMLFNWRSCFAGGQEGAAIKKTYPPSERYPLGALFDSPDSARIGIDLACGAGDHDGDHDQESYHFDSETDELRVIGPVTEAQQDGARRVPEDPFTLHERIARIIFDHYNIERAAFSDMVTRRAAP